MAMPWRSCLDEEDSAARYYLGLTLYEQGAFEEVETVLETIDDGSERARQELQRLLSLVREAAR